MGVNSKCGVQNKRRCESHESCICIVGFSACWCQKKSTVCEMECRHVAVQRGKQGQNHLMIYSMETQILMDISFPCLEIKLIYFTSEMPSPWSHLHDIDQFLLKSKADSERLEMHGERTVLLVGTVNKQCSYGGGVVFLVTEGMLYEADMLLLCQNSPALCQMLNLCIRWIRVVFIGKWSRTHLVKCTAIVRAKRMWALGRTNC